jgi:hypothetical protein
VSARLVNLLLKGDLARLATGRSFGVLHKLGQLMGLRLISSFAGTNIYRELRSFQRSMTANSDKGRGWGYGPVVNHGTDGATSFAREDLQLLPRFSLLIIDVQSILFSIL